MNIKKRYQNEMKKNYIQYLSTIYTFITLWVLHSTDLETVVIIYHKPTTVDLIKV